MGSMAVLAITLVICASLAITVEGQSLRWVCLGDWGGQPNEPYTTAVQLQVAKQVGETAASFDSHFVMAIGDNFYDSGVETVDSIRFKRTFEDVYTAPSLMNRWYVLAGNHDHRGNVSAQIAYTQRSSRWYFPSEWYTEVLSIPGTNASVQFIYFDTVVFSGDSDAKPPKGPSDRLKAETQYQWLKATLASSVADWIFVVGHYPVWSIAEHGPTADLVQYVKPLLEKYGVAAFLNGHDHTMQHLNDGSTVDYYVLGAAHSSTNDKSHAGSVPLHSSKFYWPDDNSNEHGAFATVEVSVDMMTLNIVEDTGKVLYTSAKTNPRKKM